MPATARRNLVMKFTFWANIFSPHLVPVVRSLAALGHEVTMVAEQAVSPQRAAMGWRAPDLGNVRGVLAPDERAVQELVTEDLAERVHIVAGVRFEPLGVTALRAFAKHGARWGIVSESADPRGVTGALRRWKYGRERARIGGSLHFVLAMGTRGVDWFLRAGYDSDRLFEFAYAVDTPSSTRNVSRADCAARVLYVGQMIQRKGVDTLLQACARLDDSFTLGLVGTGERESALRKLSQDVGVDDRCDWLGAVPSAAVHQAMEAADVLVLPSYHDGWGAVVNEALMTGLPVICSEQCGAACLIQGALQGAAFPAGDVAGLSSALRAQLERAKDDPTARRDQISAWASCIADDAIADYFERVMVHVYGTAERPAAPWRRRDR